MIKTTKKLEAFYRTFFQTFDEDATSQELWRLASRIDMLETSVRDNAAELARICTQLADGDAFARHYSLAQLATTIERDGVQSRTESEALVTAIRLCYGPDAAKAFRATTTPEGK